MILSSPKHFLEAGKISGKESFQAPVVCNCRNSGKCLTREVFKVFQTKFKHLCWSPEWHKWRRIRWFCSTLQVHNYPGGEIQWARFRKDVSEYESDEEMAFGTSINNHRSQMTFGTLRIKSNGLRAPHWHFNANEHGYLLQVLPDWFSCPHGSEASCLGRCTRSQCWWMIKPELPSADIRCWFSCLKKRFQMEVPEMGRLMLLMQEDQAPSTQYKNWGGRFGSLHTADFHILIPALTGISYVQGPLKDCSGASASLCPASCVGAG